MNLRASALFLVLFTSTLFTACTSNGQRQEDSRGPSSLSDDMRIDSALSEIAGSHEMASETETLLNSIAAIYFHTQDYVKEFDLLLEDPKSTDLMTSLTYAKLMSSRMLMETASDRIVSQYEELLSRYKDAVQKKSGVSEARADLNKFTSSITQPVFMTGGNRLALQNVVTELAQRAPARVASLENFKSFLFKDAKELTAYINDENNKSDFNAKVAAAISDRVILRNVQLIAPFVRFELQAQLGTREPQSIAPGTGANGNLTGSNFPRDTWALTFDDGPSSYTLPILANLKSHGIKASFFWLAKNVSGKNAGKYISAAKSAGMDLNNHSYSHANLVNLGAAGLQKEIVTSTSIETQAYGFAPKYFRCPYGSGLNTARVRSMIAQQGMIHVFWNVDSLDWQDHNPSSIVARVRNQMAREGRGIILFHDIHPQSVTASNVIMGDLAKRHAVTVSEITKMLNGQ